MSTVKLCIGGLRDHADEARVEGALRSEAGVLGAVANHEAACAEIDFEDDEVDVDHLVDVVRRLGYEAELGG